MALALFVGAISSGTIYAQEEAEGGEEAVEDAEDNQRLGLRVSLTRLAPPAAAEEEAPAEEVADADAGEGDGDAAGADEGDDADEGDEADEADERGGRGRGERPDRGERPEGGDRPDRGNGPDGPSGLVILTSVGDVFQSAVVTVNGLEAGAAYQVVTGEDGAPLGSLTTQGEGRGAGSGALQLTSTRDDDVDVDSLAGSALSVVDGEGKPQLFE